MSDRSSRTNDTVDATRAAPAARAPGKATLTSRLMRRADGNRVADGAEDAVARAATSGGAPLPGSVRERFEGSLGADLSSVRVHTGDDSANAASAVGARAYTVGNDIHFGAGQYAHGDPFGLHLLAHEVAHTQQQAGGSPHRQHKLEVSAPGDAAEVDADRAADAMVAGASSAISHRSGGGTMFRSVEGPGGTDGPGGASGTAPTAPAVPKWYQWKSTNVERDSSKATIYFGTDDADLTPDDLAAIEQFAKDYGGLLQSGEYELEILGYADKRADDAYNDDLAARRAGKVFDQLGKRLPGGMPDDSNYRSIGEVPSSNNPDDLARNRRVEIRLRKHEGPPPVPLPNLDPPKPSDPSWKPPADWSTDWSLTVEMNGGGGEVANAEGASLIIKNLKNGEQQRFGYAGLGIGASAAPASASWSGGPVPFKTTAPVSIKDFASIDNAHLQVGVSMGPLALGMKVVLGVAGIHIPNGLSGEVWVLTGPRAHGADVVYVNTSGTANTTPNVGLGGTIGPTF